MLRGEWYKDRGLVKQTNSTQRPQRLRSFAESLNLERRDLAVRHDDHVPIWPEIFLSMTITSPNKALHRTAICAWGYALEFFVFIRQAVAVGEFGRSCGVRRRSAAFAHA